MSEDILHPDAHSSPGLRHRAVVVTGAGGGMGRVHAASLAARGWVVGVCDLDGNGAHEVAAGVNGTGGKAVAFQVDVRDSPAVSGVVEALAEEADVVGLVNNAGIGSPPMLLGDLSVENFREMFDVHLLGAVNFIKAVTPHMTRLDYGRIVNIASYCVLKGSVGYSHYCAAKAALVGMTKSVALELADAGITVNAVAPGLIETPMTAGEAPERRKHNLETIPLGRYGRPEEIAGLVGYLLSDEAGYLTGQTIHINGGMVLG